MMIIIQLCHRSRELYIYILTELAKPGRDPCEEFVSVQFPVQFDNDVQIIEQV